MRKFSLFLFFLLIVVLTSVYIVLYTPLLTSYVIPKIVQVRYPEIELASLRIKGQKFRISNVIILSGVSFTIRHKGMSIDCKLPKVALTDILRIQTKDPVFKIRSMDGDIGWEGGYIRKLQFNLLMKYQKKFLDNIDGIVAGEGVRVGFVDFEGFTARLRKNGTKLEFFEIMLDSYGGRGKGQASVTDMLSPDYVVWLEFSDLKPQELRKMNEEVFSQLSGNLDGSIRMVGDTGGITLFSGRLAFAKGGTLQQALVKKIANKIRDEEQKKKLLNNTSGELPLEEGSLNIDQSRNQDLLFSLSLDSTAKDIHLREIIRMGPHARWEDFVRWRSD